VFGLTNEQVKSTLKAGAAFASAAAAFILALKSKGS